jgi:hypothetical protein
MADRLAAVERFVDHRSRHGPADSAVGRRRPMCAAFAVRTLRESSRLSAAASGGVEGTIGPAAGIGEVRNPKHEILKKFESQISKARNKMSRRIGSTYLRQQDLKHSGFGF